MKKVNFWKTLFLSALAVTAFTGCSNDDSENDGGMPSITVNGESTATGAVDLTGGTLTFEVVSSSDWTLAYDDTSAMSWCHVATAGKGGTTSLEVTVDAWSEAQGNAERTAKFTLTTYGNLAGVGAIPAKATITVKQNGTGSTEVTTNVKEVRAALAFDGQAVAASTVVTGIVVSDYVGNNINNHQIMITDNTTESGAGLLIRFKGYIGNKDTDYNLTKGMIVSLDLQGGIAQRYNDIQYQVDFTNATDPQISIEDSGDNTPEPITVTDLSKLVDYQSQYVQIYSQPVESIRGEKYYNVNSGYANQTFQTKDGSTFDLSFMSYTSSWASTVEIPANAGYIKGCVSFNYQTPTLSPRNADDLTGMTEALFTVESKTATIGQITGEGEFEVKDVIVINRSDIACMIADNTGTMLLYGNNELAVGDKINISGPVTVYQAPNNTPQFSVSTATIEKVSSGNNWSYSFTEYTVDDVRSYLNNVECVAIQLAGTIVKDGNHYNLVFDGVSDLQGSIQYYTPEASVLDVPVIVKGYAVGKSSSQGINRIKVFPYEITVNSSTPYISATAPATFKADGETINVSFTAGNLGSNKVFAKLENNEDGQFSVPSGEISGNSVAVTAKANELGKEASATLVIYVAASEGGAAVAQTSVALKQSKPAAAGAETIELDFSTSSYDIPASSSATEATFSANGYTFKYRYLKYYEDGNYLMFDAKSNEGSYMVLPAISGKKLVKVTITNRSNASATAKVAIYPEDSTTAVAGGEAAVWPELPSDLTFNLTDTEAGVAYRIYAIKGKNAQAVKIVLEYE